ncbi:glycosyltransferase family 2 protein [Cytophagaceae bacterium ABcell3]|nr:glycosyltransferase family 2 protein [Cytophagaceae bacterium ABcell3]
MTEHEGVSILIPVYNTDVRELVRSLADDANNSKILHEIVCFDDASRPSIKQTNRFITNIPNVRYKELPQNIGRSAIRNALAEEASYNYIIFLDCDSGILPGFLLRYMPFQKFPVVIGGRMYTSTPPGPEYTLHWTVGSQRELYNPEQRQKKPYEHFMLNNLMIRKDVFRSIKLDENIHGYGHEDTKFGFELKGRGIKIQYINNPVFHMGLDSNRDFLKKTIEGVKNFYQISKEGFGTNAALYKAFTKLKKARMLNVFHFIMKNIKGLIEKNLLSESPNLTLFDLYKLYIFTESYKKGVYMIYCGKVI